MVAQAPAPTRPPATIEDFLWNIHSVMVAQNEPIVLDSLKDAYSKHLGHKCSIERFLVVGEGGFAATLKRIPHIVTVIQDGSVPKAKATQPADTTKQGLIDADANYRRELVKKNAAAKAKAQAAQVAKAAPAPAKAAAAPAAAPAEAAGTAEAKRPADAAAGGEAKKPRTDASDQDTLARMLVQGVVRVLQNRQKAGKGALPVNELEEEFKALWKVPFNLKQAGEEDAIAFLNKWPLKVEVVDGNMIQLPKKAAEKAKAAAPAADDAAPASTAKAAPAAAAAAAAAAPPAKAAAPKASEGAAPSKPPAADAAKAPAANGGAAKADAAAGGAAAAKATASGPTRPPASIEDFLWNIHSVIEAAPTPLPLDSLKDAYSKQLGHKCAIERFLVVGEGGLAATLKRIPHIVTVTGDKDVLHLKATQPKGTTREQLIAADHGYRRQLQQKNKAAPPAPAAKPAAAAPEAAAKPAAAPSAPALEKRPSSDAVGGEKDSKKPKGEDAETLARMLVQGIVRVLQNRAKDGKGPLPVSELADEFKALWKVPFNLQQAGETDAVAFLQKWPAKVKVTEEGGKTIVLLAKKGAGAEKPKAEGAAPAASSGGAASTAAPTAPASTNGAVTTKDTTAAARVDRTGEVPETLPEIREHAKAMLATMQEMCKRQEALVAALSRLE